MFIIKKITKYIWILLQINDNNESRMRIYFMYTDIDRTLVRYINAP